MLEKETDNMVQDIFDIDKLKKDFNLSDKAINGCGFSIDELTQVFYDYQQRIKTELEPCMHDFLSDYIIKADGIRFHSYGARVKDPYHLIEKIVRKRHNNDKKYALMQSGDYYKYITDLIGCRILLVYKEDWKQIHEYLVRIFENSKANYIDEDHYAQSYDIPFIKPFIAEQPVIYIRPGDNEEVYNNVNGIDISKKGYYRSAHYIIRLEKHYVELQVRSLFDEAWGEVDHDVLYPYHKDETSFVEFSQIINRISGTGDELAAYFKKYVPQTSNLDPSKNALRDVPLLPLAYEKEQARSAEYSLFRHSVKPLERISTGEAHQEKSTPKNELNRIIKTGLEEAK